MLALAVFERDDARVASFTTAAAAVFLLLVLADDALPLALFRRPADSMFLTIAVAMAVAGLQMLVTLAALIAAPLYYMAAMRADVAAGPTADPKALFGLVGVLASALSFVVLVTRQRWPNQVVAFGMRGGWETHAALHREAGRALGGAG